MFLEGKVFKDGKFWLAEIPALDLISQGRSIHESEEMIQDAVLELINDPKFVLHLVKKSKQSFLIGCSQEDKLIALMLKRLRVKYGLTLLEVAKRLGSSSANSFARYEQGKAKPTISKLMELLQAIDPKIEPILKI
ncbi:MAG: helix-turn-helix transcriptional regulator [Deltaproteobacteria bacterium]|nr:helix-turn-helix transcriptional regulator [Deltaproteobacteria bacterium]